MNPIDLKGKAFVITGSTGSIGFEVARVFAEAGALVVVTGRNQAKCEDYVGKLKESHADAEAIAVAADLVRFEDCAQLVDKTVTTFGRLDGMIHCAVDAPPGSQGAFMGTNPASYPRFLEDALGTLYNCCHAAIPAITQSGGGSLIAYVSDYGKLPGRNASLISSTRSGAMLFMRSLALELAGDKIRSNCISPTFVRDTPIYDMMLNHDGRAAKATSRARLGLPNPTELAYLTAYLCSPIADKITAQVISVNGGLSGA